MKIASTQYSVANRSFEVYLSGCDGFCGEDCHNKELWDKNIGEDYLLCVGSLIRKIDDYSEVIDSVWVLGGEPLLNCESDLLDLVDSLIFSSKGKPIYLFTRFELDEIRDPIKSRFDFIKCGCYNREKVDDNYYSNGIKLSTNNQKVYQRGKDY